MFTGIDVLDVGLLGSDTLARISADSSKLTNGAAYQPFVLPAGAPDHKHQVGAEYANKLLADMVRSQALELEKLKKQAAAHAQKEANLQSYVVQLDAQVKRQAAIHQAELARVTESHKAQITAVAQSGKVLVAQSAQQHQLQVAALHQDLRSMANSTARTNADLKSANERLAQASADLQAANEINAKLRADLAAHAPAQVPAAAASYNPFLFGGDGGKMMSLPSSPVLSPEALQQPSLSPFHF